MGKKQTKVAVHVGIDVSKGTLDIRALQEKDEQLLAPMKVTMAPQGPLMTMQVRTHASSTWRTMLSS